jgi:hypothetical protein
MTGSSARAGGRIPKPSNPRNATPRGSHGNVAQTQEACHGRGVVPRRGVVAARAGDPAVSSVIERIPSVTGRCHLTRVEPARSGRRRVGSIRSPAAIPGAAQFTLTPWRPSSRATVRVNPRMAHLDDE